MDGGWEVVGYHLLFKEETSLVALMPLISAILGEIGVKIYSGHAVSD